MRQSMTTQITKALTEYSFEVAKKSEEAGDKVGKEAVSKLKNESPRRTGDYAKSWRLKKEKGSLGVSSFVVYNKDHYQLTHLLENGHVIKNKKGTYGRTSPKKHIQPVYDWIEDALVNEIERKLK